MRGEQHLQASLFAFIIGSPPLARGTEYPVHIGRAYPGITPACAGNRHSSGGRHITSKDHPRLRGEQPQAYSISYFMAGSPPLARGTDFSAKAISAAFGITPACAGNRYHPFTAEQKEKDHPRLRGEQCFWHGRLAAGIGSPPLARGTVIPTALRSSRAGITPACAGNRIKGLPDNSIH